MATITSVRIRALLIISITVVVVLLFLASAGNAASEITGTFDYRVQPGDTVWDIAAEFGPRGQDRRSVVATIERMNGLTPGVLMAGQVIEIPIVTSQ